jgi:hypothetical protein
MGRSRPEIWWSDRLRASALQTSVQRQAAETILQEASRYIEDHGLEPSAERKLVQARRGLGLARLVLESGDLSDQVLALGCFDLAAALDRLIHAQPCRDELRAGLEVGEKLVSL